MELILITSDICPVSALQDEQMEGNIVGLNLTTGGPMDPIQEGVYDSFRVLRNCLASSAGIASNLLLCDELLKARQMVSFHSSLQLSCHHTELIRLLRDDNTDLDQGKGKGEGGPAPFSPSLVS